MTRNPPLLVALAGFRFVLFPIPVITLFFMDQIGMSLMDVMVLQAIFGLAVVLFEFPSGYLADRVGYRTSLLIGAALAIAGWSVYAGATSFVTVALAETILGAAVAFISGADAALLFVSLAAQGRGHQYTRWEGRVRASGQTAEALSSAVGGWLYAVGPRWPFWLQIPNALLVLVTATCLAPEPRRVSAEVSHVERARRIVRFALREHPRLRVTMALSVVLGLATFVMVWLLQPWMQRRGIPAAWFGPIWAAAHLWLAVVSLASGRLVQALGRRGALLGCCLLAPTGYAVFALGAAPWVVVAYLLFMTSRGLQGPILAAALQEDAPGADRATVLSLNALLFRLSFVVCGPAIGRLVDWAGLERSLGLLAAGFGVVGLGAYAAFARAHARAGARRDD